MFYLAVSFVVPDSLSSFCTSMSFLTFRMASSILRRRTFDSSYFCRLISSSLSFCTLFKCSIVALSSSMCAFVSSSLAIQLRTSSSYSCVSWIIVCFSVTTCNCLVLILASSSLCLSRSARISSINFSRRRIAASIASSSFLIKSVMNRISFRSLPRAASCSYTVMVFISSNFLLLDSNPTARSCPCRIAIL